MNAPPELTDWILGAAAGVGAMMLGMALGSMRMGTRMLDRGFRLSYDPRSTEDAIEMVEKLGELGLMMRRCDGCGSYATHTMLEERTVGEVGSVASVRQVCDECPVVARGVASLEVWIAIGVAGELEAFSAVWDLHNSRHDQAALTLPESFTSPDGPPAPEPPSTRA